MQMNSYRILLVEDEDSLAVGLEFNLIEEGYSVSRAQDGRQALEQFQAEKFDLIILDIMLPYIDGFTVAKEMRKDDPQIPILMLTARTHAEDRVQGLEIGADDYMVKPFNLAELLARVKGMLRRKAWYKQVIDQHPTFQIGDMIVNFETLQCQSEKTAFTLTPKEAMVLRHLIDNQGKIVSRKELLEQVWHMTGEIDTRTVDNFIARLRKYFEPNPREPIYIKSKRSAGYIFENCASDQNGASSGS